MKFTQLPLSQNMIQHLEQIGYKDMMPVQEKSIEKILNNNNLLIKAQTGSGKTATFAIPLLEKLDVKTFRVQHLILAPTRELATQISNEFRKIAKFKHNIKILTLIGGESFKKQSHSLSHHSHIIVGVPGRVLRHLEAENLTLENLKTVVFDEADKMFEMGFEDEIDAINSFIHADIQKLFLSATYTDEILEILNGNTDLIRVEVEEQNLKDNLEEFFYKTDDKLKTLVSILYNYQPKHCIIFTNTKVFATELSQELHKHNIDAIELHGDLEQFERDDSLIEFSNGSARVLVATDVASRGLDIKELDLVINYDKAKTDEIYTHRIGRTARVDAKGVAISLFDNNDEIENITNLQKYKDGISQIKELKATYKTVLIEGGKKAKISAGDIVGILTATKQIKAQDIGDITIFANTTYVAIKHKVAQKANQILQNSKIKNRFFNTFVLQL